MIINEIQKEVSEYIEKYVEIVNLGRMNLRQRKRSIFSWQGAAVQIDEDFDIKFKLINNGNIHLWDVRVFVGSKTGAFKIYSPDPSQYIGYYWGPQSEGAGPRLVTHNQLCSSIIFQRKCIHGVDDNNPLHELCYGYRTPQENAAVFNVRAHAIQIVDSEDLEIHVTAEPNLSGEMCRNYSLQICPMD